MNTVGFVPVRDYVANVATVEELDELAKLAEARREALRNRPDDKARQGDDAKRIWQATRHFCG